MAGYYLQRIAEFMQYGLNIGFGNVNNTLLFIIIALISGLQLNGFRRLWLQAMAATILHRVAEVMIPVLASETPFLLPTNLIGISYWEANLVLFFAYLFVIGMLFILKVRFFIGAIRAPVKHH